MEPSLTLIRHGDTEWSQNGRHTSVTDLELLASGRERAAALARALDPYDFALVLASPRRRALETARLAGFGARLEVVDDLVEWNYGDYEGLTSPEIRARRPDWDLWRDGCPGGESPEQVGARVQRLIGRAVAADGNVICFAHGHVLRALAASWIGAELSLGEHLPLFPATVCRLGHEHTTRVIERWNAPVIT